MNAVPRQLKAVLFDLDGTLIDTASEFVVVVQRLRAEHDLAPADETLIRSQVSNGARALVTVALGLNEGDAEFEEKRLRLLDIYAAELGKTAHLYPGMEDLLATFEDRGIRWGIATNKPRTYTEPLLAALGLAPGSVVCPDDVADRKPHPESLYRNCRELDCAPHQAIYIGDHLRDIEAGRRAGMHTIAAAYGYIVDGDSAEQWGADRIATRSEDLHAMIFTPVEDHAA